MRLSLRTSVAVVAAAGLATALATALAACHTDPYAAGAADAAAGGDGGGDGGLLVIGPADGDTVTPPFQVAVAADVELGPAEDGLHHLEIWFGDAREDTLTRHFEGETTVAEAPEGETTMWVRLADAERRPVGEPISLALTVEPAADDQDADDQDAGDSGDESGESGESGEDSEGEESGGEEPGGDGYGDGY